ncbi:MAG: radical SAM protein [Acidobacteriota bacterium]|jgi:molybdenum cofactor biosynthesis enzyme MoaA
MPEAPPSVPLLSLDTVWFQVAGTLCNLRCTHCFIACAPDNHSHGMMTLAEVRGHLREAVRLGVKDYYFTGGEPFLNRELLPILEATLEVGPATVLTNGLLLDPARARRLRGLSDGSPYSLDLRISLDGYEEDAHDAIRGSGTFRRALEGAANLAAVGLSPVITVTELTPEVGRSEGRAAFLDRLRRSGLRPRLKVLSVFRIGREESRSRGYHRRESLRGHALGPGEAEALQCSSSRMITSRGVYVCPILIDHEDARMGSGLAETLRGFPLGHGACYTCHAYGVTCRT